MVSGHEALGRLREGNRRFVASMPDTAPALSQTRRLALAEGQQPFAIVLGCSDSRVPAELVFGQGFGDLFVIRVAGNIVAPSQVGSVEFAAARFGTRLVVVLGHTECGAITATIEELRQPTLHQSAGLRAIVDRIPRGWSKLPAQGGTVKAHAGPVAPDPWLVAGHMASRAWTLLPLATGTLATGMAIYHWVEHLPWPDAFLNAAMLLGGMGPVDR